MAGKSPKKIWRFSSVAKSTVNGEISGKHVTDEPIPPAVRMQGIQDIIGGKELDWNVFGGLGYKHVELHVLLFSG
jgi:hypothetical protein